MSTDELSSQSPRRARLSVAAALAIVGVGAALYGAHPSPALAEPGSAAPPHATTPLTPQSVQPREAIADLDYGPGQCEPYLVGSP